MSLLRAMCGDEQALTRPLRRLPQPFQEIPTSGASHPDALGEALCLAKARSTAGECSRASHEAREQILRTTRLRECVSNITRHG